MGKKKSNKAKVRHIEENRVKRISAEIKRCKQKLEKLLARSKENKSGGIVANSKQHAAILDHIKGLEGKLRGKNG